MNYLSTDITDNETVSSWNQTDDELDSDDEDAYYEPEEPSLTKYNLVVCERYDPALHGDVTGEINDHYLTILRFKQCPDYELRPSFLRGSIELAECLQLPSGHCVAILKTHWIRLIQRVWKVIYHQRKLMLSRRCTLTSLHHRELHGMWPSHCATMPAWSGALARLSRRSL